MKNVFKKVLTIGALAGAFVTGYFVNESDSVKMETPVQAETQVQQCNNNVKQGLNKIESNERNVFTQYFTITAIDEKGTDVVNQYNENDTYYIDKQDYDLDFNELEVGTKIAVTFDHDTTLTAELDYRYIGQYKLVSAKDYNVNIDESQYIYGINNDKPSDTIVLEKEDWQIGDLVNVTFNSEKPDDIKKVEKVGMWKEDLDRFYEKPNTEKQVEKAELKTQNNEKVNENVQTLKNEQKEVKKEESSEKQEVAKTEQKQVENENSSVCELEDSFKENAQNDVNKDNPDYVQTEDGSYVPKNFWD
ncbi:hypothetical protein [Bacillus phage vB_BanS-Thrax1]|nr:hypothetical protein [Bacillus phage vB_BanS-Thrax1]